MEEKIASEHTGTVLLCQPTELKAQKDRPYVFTKTRTPSLLFPKKHLFLFKSMNRKRCNIRTGFSDSYRNNCGLSYRSAWFADFIRGRRCSESPSK